MTRIILRTSWAAAPLLLGACEQAGPAATLPQAVPDAVVPAITAAASPQAARVSEIASRLQAQYNSGARDFPPMSGDPRESLSPETMQMMIATAERLARMQNANAD